MDSITRIKDFIGNNFPKWEKVDYSKYGEDIDFRKDWSELYKIDNEEVILISYTNISITGTDRAKPQLRVFLEEYKKPFYFAKKYQLRFYLFSIFTKEDKMAKGLNNFNPKEYIISIETNLDNEDSRRDLRSIYDYANVKLNGKKFLKCTRANYKADINQASFIYIGTPENPDKQTFESFINIFDSRPYINSRNDSITQNASPSNRILQQIFYGAPGTGKSHEVKMMTNKDNSIRTTFHPDSDYSTFVGAYKPIVDERPRYGLNQKETVRLMDEDKQPLNEKAITYAFVPQAFIKAYAEAWSRYAKWQQGNGEGQPQSYYLVIEEINRGNCAQIFGDLFQLLDRCGNGLSGYAISPDNDIQRYLSETKFDPSKAQWGLQNLELTGMFVDDEGEVLSTADEIKSGRLMLLPPNLHIWATMNTSDQSLFPIDSAFKRRWEWKYMPISYKNEGWTIKIGDKTYKWVDFQRNINERIYDIDNSEDKQLGDYFVNADWTGNVIKADTLLNKILFYIWNDVCKDEPEQIFSCEDVHGNKKAVKFSDFFCEGAEQDQKLQDFMRYNKVRAIGEDAAEAKENSNETDNEVIA